MLIAQAIVYANKLAASRVSFNNKYLILDLSKVVLVKLNVQMAVKDATIQFANARYVNNC